MESKKRTKKIKDTQKQKEISKVAEEDNGETVEMQAENSLVGFKCFFLVYLNIMEFIKVERLLKKSELSEAAIRSQYRSFMSICPDGVMSREKFLQLAEVGIFASIFKIFFVYIFSKFSVTRQIFSSTRCSEYSTMITAAALTSRNLSWP